MTRTIAVTIAVVAAAAGGWAAPSEDQASQPALRIVRVIEVTDGKIEHKMHVWSPDGTKLALTGPDFRGVYVARADGLGSVREIPDSDSTRCHLTWTHDSRALLGEVRTAPQKWCLGRIDVETGEVEAIDGPLAGCDGIRKTSYGDVTFTVRRKMEVLNYKTGDKDKIPYDETLFLDLLTGKVQSISEYYSAARPASGEIRLKRDFRARKMWVIEGNGLNQTEFPHSVILAYLSPMRDRVLVLLEDSNWYVSSFDGSSMVNVGRGDSWVWSADGKRLAYAGAVEESEWNVVAAELFIVNADGTGTTQLTHTPDVVEGYPVWAPDGMKIAYSAWNTRKIYVAILEEVK